MADLIVREYGSGPAAVVALHGGPAAAGDVAPLAGALGRRWRVLEPFQRGHSDGPLSVAVHVRDLHDIIRTRCANRQPVLVGHSWGAMLALAYAAAHPTVPAGLGLIGCGTFSPEARAEFEARRAKRLWPKDRAALAAANRLEPEDRRLAAVGRLMTRIYGYDIDEDLCSEVTFDSRAHRETWDDMVRLQREGVYPVSFEAIRTPVLMLHGDADPHPGLRTSLDLSTYMPQLEYHELPECGHSPWLERRAAQPFFEKLEGWIDTQLESVLAEQAG